MPAAYEVRIAPEAEKDLAAIYDFIARDSPANAKNFVLWPEGGCVSLQHFPEGCPLIPENELLGASYRHLIQGQYRVLFKVIGSKVVVMRIIHAARLLEDALFEG